MAVNWKRIQLGGGKWKTVIPSLYARLLKDEDILLVQSGFVFEEGDIIQVKRIEAKVISSRKAGGRWDGEKWVDEWGKFNWVLGIKCKEMDKLREKIAFRVEGE